MEGLYHGQKSKIVYDNPERKAGCSIVVVYMHGVRSENLELRKAGARRREAGLKDFSVEKYFWPCRKQIYN